MRALDLTCLGQAAWAGRRCSVGQTDQVDGAMVGCLVIDTTPVCQQMYVRLFPQDLSQLASEGGGYRG